MLNHNIKPYFISTAAIIIVAVELFKMSMKVPESDIEYKAYSINFHTLNFLILVLMGAFICSLITNKVVRCAMVVLMVLNAGMMLKLKLDIADKHTWIIDIAGLVIGSVLAYVVLFGNQKKS